MNNDGFDIKAGVDLIEEQISGACARCGRKREEIRLMAVSKFHPLESVEEAYKQGIRLFGENRVQEGISKFSKFRENFPAAKAEVHLIGSLQRNKAKSAVQFFDCIQSVDRDPLIEELGALTGERKTPLIILLEYHTGEESKAGFSGLDSLYRGAEKALSCPGLSPQGLMTLAPFTDDEKTLRASFRQLYRAAEELEKRFPQDGGKKRWTTLSMGMSGDFEIAIEEGSTLVRIGTAIFGARHL
ncbi:MAG: YggS family pyridoxal phosphate-dependent enzyme [Treponema sp.]|jgi:pyridoxal phosphate enzyme (YggS family)|nr:YggS family pyridoxal phosphate-dependent enzyme [Treponema sp.]